MILPRYSIRTVLYLAVLVAMVAMIAGQAVQGAAWAIAVTIGIGSFAVCWMVFVLFYGIVAAFARVAHSRNNHALRPAYYPEPRHPAAVDAEDAPALNTTTDL